MSTPVIAQSPAAVLVSVEDADLAVDGARRAAVAMAIEGNCLDKVLVAVLEDVFEPEMVVDHRRVVQKGRRFGHFGQKYRVLFIWFEGASWRGCFQRGSR